MKRLLIALTIGLQLTAALFALAYFTVGSTASKVAYWQGWLLQFLVPTVNIGTAQRPFYEATPMHVLAFFAGLPLGIIIYTVLAYLLLGFLPNPTFQWTATQPLN